MPQATVQRYDSLTREGTLLGDDGQTTYEIEEASFEGSMFRFLRPGQRVTFDLVEEDDRQAVRGLRIGVA